MNLLDPLPTRSLRACTVAFVLLGTMLVSWPAWAVLKVKWDCYLPDSGIDCAVLESSLTSKIPFLRIVPTPGEADVSATLTSLPAEDGTRFKLDFIGRAADGYANEVHSTDKIPSSIDATTATVRILTRLERSLADFMDQRIAAEVRAGTLDLQLTDPANLPFTGRPEQSSVKWYLAPGVGIYFSDVVGVGINAAGNASLSFNYSASTWRFQQTIGANYSQQSQPVAGTNETASIRFVGANTSTILSRAISSDNRWSLALLASAEKNPQANFTIRANGSVGLEFDLVPRQTENQKSFGFRCAVGPEYQRYDSTNIQGLNHQSLGRQFCDLFLTWHFQPVDVRASVGETSILEDISYRSFSAGLSVIWRLTDNLIIAPWVGVQQTNQAINEAQTTNINYTDPRQEVEASMRAAVQQGYTAPFGVQSGLSIRFLFGNGSLSIEDQRWKGTSNLR